MKKYFGLQKVILALTTLTLVGLSSCNDHNFDWDEAHATQQYEKFTNVFIKEFGKPAEGHQWGFDAAQLALSGGVESSTSSTRASWKQDEVKNWPGGFAKYGKPNDITYKEHFEVLAWFSNHRVTWTNSPSIISPDGSSRTLIKSTAYEIDSNNRSGYGSLINDFNINNGVIGDAIISTQLNFTAGWVQTVAQYEESSKLYSCSPDRSKGKDCPSRKIAYGYKSTTGEIFLYDGKYVQSDESGTAKPGGIVTGENPDDIYFYKVLFDKKIVLYKDKDNNIYKERADHDQGDKYVHYTNNFDKTTNGPGATLPSNDDLQFYHSDLVKSSHMDWVNYWDDEIKNYNDLKDWNNNKAAYGWGRQPSTDIDGLYPEYGKTPSSGQNATLITNANVNQFAYKESVGGGQLHDKYIMVYLKGDDYEGWYIGFDHEAYDPYGVALNRNAFADGICNDWIIKVSAAGNASYENVRIMCEDLGGNYGKSTTDIDYNDIVLDITNKIEIVNWITNETVTLTLQAAGGTLPLIVTYKDGDWAQETILFETHEMFGTNCAWKEKLFWAGGNYKWSIVDYKTMYNTQENTDYAPTRTFVLYRGGYPPEHTPIWHTLQINNSFNIMNIGVKVYRHGLDDYVRNPQHSEEPSSADWISLKNMEQEAPLMICVPNTTKWLKERHKIDDGYPRFKDWVKDPSFEFWNTSVSTVNNDHLCE